MDMTYKEFAERYGREVADELLQTLEKFSQVWDNDDTALDEEARWQRILTLMLEPVTIH